MARLTALPLALRVPSMRGSANMANAAAFSVPSTHCFAEEASAIDNSLQEPGSPLLERSRNPSALLRFFGSSYSLVPRQPGSSLSLWKDDWIPNRGQVIDVVDWPEGWVTTDMITAAANADITPPIPLVYAPIQHEVTTPTLDSSSDTLEIGQEIDDTMTPPKRRDSDRIWELQRQLDYLLAMRNGFYTSRAPTYDVLLNTRTRLPPSIYITGSETSTDEVVSSSNSSDHSSLPEPEETMQDDQLSPHELNHDSPPRIHNDDPTSYDVNIKYPSRIPRLVAKVSQLTTTGHLRPALKSTSRLPRPVNMFKRKPRTVRFAKDPIVTLFDVNGIPKRAKEESMKKRIQLQPNPHWRKYSLKRRGARVNSIFTKVDSSDTEFHTIREDVLDRFTSVQRYYRRTKAYAERLGKPLPHRLPTAYGNAHYKIKFNATRFVKISDIVCPRKPRLHFPFIGAPIPLIRTATRIPQPINAFNLVDAS